MFAKFRASSSAPAVPTVSGTNPNPLPTLPPKRYHSTLLLLEAHNLAQFPSPPPSHIEISETPSTKSHNRTTFDPDSQNRRHENTYRRNIRTLREQHDARNSDMLFKTAIAPAVEQARQELEETDMEMRYAAQVENRLLEMREKAKTGAKPKRESWFGPPTPNIDTANELRARAELQDAMGAIRPMMWTTEIMEKSDGSRPSSMRSRPGSMRSISMRPGSLMPRESMMSGVSSVYTPRSSVLSFGTVQGRAETEMSEWPSPKGSMNSAGSIRSFLDAGKGKGRGVGKEEEEIPEMELEMWRPRDVTAGR